MGKRIITEELENLLNQEKETLTIEREYDEYTAYDIIGFLDCKIITYNDRQDLVFNILNNNYNYYKMYFDTHFKYSPKQKEGNSSSDKVCKSLEKMADYLLFSEENRPKKSQSYNYYTDETLYKKQSKNREIEDSQNEYEVPIDILIKDRNYKFERKQNYCIDCDNCRIGCSWGKKLLQNKQPAPDVGKKILADYQKMIEHCKQINKTHMCKDLKIDQLLIKDKMNGTIYFKSPLKDSTKTDYFLFNFTNNEHVNALLKFNPRNIKNTENVDIVDLVYDLNNYLNKCVLTDNEKIILNKWRENDSTQESIAEELNTTQQNINAIINQIVKKIIKQYLLKKEDWIYLNYKKGKYKKCSKCGEIKLITHFGKDNRENDGFYRICKQCR